MELHHHLARAVVELDPGDRLDEVIAEACEEVEGMLIDVDVTGVVSSAILEDGGEPRDIKNAVLVFLRGTEERVGLVATKGTLMGGTLRRVVMSSGRATLTFSAKLEGAPMPASPETPAREAEAAEEPKAVTGWGAAISASAEVQKREKRSFQPAERRKKREKIGPTTPGAPLAKVDDDDEDHWPSVHDYIDHKSFGLCRVEKLDDEGNAWLKSASGGRRRRIKLDVMQVLAPIRHADGKKVFPVVPRKKR